MPAPEWGAQVSAAMGFVREKMGAQRRQGLRAQPQGPSSQIHAHQASELILWLGSREQPKAPANSCGIRSKGFSLHIM